MSSEIEKLAVTPSEHAEVAELIYTVDKSKTVTLLNPPPMYLVADESLTLTPSFLNYSNKETKERDCVTEYLETAPISLRVRARVGASYLNNNTPFQVNIRQVPAATYFTQPEPTLITAGRSMITLFNLDEKPIRIQEGDIIAECADIENELNKPALHEKMTLLLMRSLFIAEVSSEVINLAKAIGRDSAKPLVIPKPKFTESIIMNYLKASKRPKPTTETVLPIIIDGKELQPAVANESNSSITICEESSATKQNKSSPLKPFNGVQLGDEKGERKLSESQLHDLTELITETRILDAYPLGHTTPTIKATFQTTGTASYSRLSYFTYRPCSNKTADR